MRAVIIQVRDDEKKNHSLQLSAFLIIDRLPSTFLLPLRNEHPIYSWIWPALRAELMNERENGTNSTQQKTHSRAYFPSTFIIIPRVRLGISLYIIFKLKPYKQSAARKFLRLIVVGLSLFGYEYYMAYLREISRMNSNFQTLIIATSSD